MISYAKNGTVNPIEPWQREWALFFIFELTDFEGFAANPAFSTAPGSASPARNRRTERRTGAAHLMPKGARSRFANASSPGNGPRAGSALHPLGGMLVARS